MGRTPQVPLMSRIDRAVVQQAGRSGVRLIQQFGTGIEGVDRLAAEEEGIPVCTIPAHDCGNASSCAEHAFWMLLTLLRYAWPV